MLQKLAQNSPKLVNMLNSSHLPDLARGITDFLVYCDDAHLFLETNFKEFYEETAPWYNFEIQSLWHRTLKDPKVRPLALKTMLDCVSDKSLHKKDVDFFLYKYIQLQTEDDKVFWDFDIKLPKSEIPEATKLKIQETITPENALFLIQTSESPLFIHNLLQSVGASTPETIAYVDAHLDYIAAEISRDSDNTLTVKMVLQELLEHEKLQPSEIKPIAEGGYSKVYKVGSKILKYGTKHRTDKIPYNSEFFLQPLLRTTLSQRNSLEIYECVNVGASNEEMYSLFKSLMDQGLVWTDIKPDNVGHLIKDNSIHFDGIDYVSHRAAGFEEEKTIPLAQPGDLVLIDLDFVFPKDGKIIVPDESTASLNYEIFSRRYKREKAVEYQQTKNVIKTMDMEF